MNCGQSRRKVSGGNEERPAFNKLNRGKGILLFSALSANLLGDLRDLSLCFPKPDQNPKTQRPPRTPAEFAEKSYLTTRFTFCQQPNRSNLLTKSMRMAS